MHQAKVKEAAEQGAALAVFPELSLVGYSPLDLLRRPSWQKSAEEQLQSLHLWLQQNYPEMAVVVGSTVAVDARSVSPKGLANCAIFLQGKRKEIRAKTLIPYYDVFWESRYFDSALDLPDSFRAPIDCAGKKLGLLICEDSWHASRFQGKAVHTHNPSKFLADAGCDFLVNISASPYERTKKELRRSTIQEAAKAHGIPIAYVNHFGAQDEILFDGDAFCFDASANLLAQKAGAGGEPLFFRLQAEPSIPKKLQDEELFDLKKVLVTGIRDYCRKNNFSSVVLGLSGGVDSALVAVLAAEAMGPENVIALAMPSKFSSAHSVEDAEALAKNLGILFRHFPIKMPHSTLLMAFKPFFEGRKEDVTEENLQSRIRGLSVMAFSNKMNALALATGNKSEFAMGYSTLYGDMCGALCPIGDLWKTEVYELCHFLNKERPVIPASTLTKAPSAELRPGQTDQDTLPPYDLLDAALRLFVEQELDPAAALKEMPKKFPVDLALLEKIHRSLRLNEFKRRQAAPILRVSSRAFGSGRAYPITATW